MLAFALVLAEAVMHAPSLGVLIAGIGAIGLLFLGLVLVLGYDALLPWAVVCLVGAYAVALL